MVGWFAVVSGFVVYLVTVEFWSPALFSVEEDSSPQLLAASCVQGTVLRALPSESVWVYYSVLTKSRTAGIVPIRQLKKGGGRVRSDWLRSRAE